MLTSKLPVTRASAAVAAVVGAVGTVVLLASFGYLWAPAIGCGVLAAAALGLVVDYNRRALAQARTQFAVAFLNSPLGLAIVDAEGRLERTNAAFGAIFGFSRTEPGNTTLPELFPAGSRDAITVALRAISIGHAPGSRIEVNLPDGGADRWLLTVMTPLHRSERSGPILVQLEETTERKAAENILQDNAVRDPLTGLGNRTALFRALDYALASGSALRSTVLFVDLDRFKWVNDTLGHAAGDAVLVETANRLRALVRPGDLGTRVGGGGAARV